MFYPDIYINSPGSINKILRLTVNSEATWIQSATDTSASSTAPLYFSGMFGGNIRMTIASNGNVGIGTTNPSNLLSLSGPGSYGLMYMGGTAGETTIMFNDPANTNPASGYTGWFVGQTSSWGSVNSSFGIARISGGVPVASTGMWINASGNVGIGIANPTQRLHVSGNILTTGALTLGGYVSFQADIWNISSEGAYRLYYQPNGTSFYQTRNEHVFRRASSSTGDRGELDIVTFTYNGDICGKILYTRNLNFTCPANGTESSVSSYTFPTGPAGGWYLVRADISFFRSGNGFDGIRFFFEGGDVYGFNYLQGFHNNVLDLGGSANSGVSALAQRTDSAVALLHTSFTLKVRSGTDDAWSCNIIITAQRVHFI
jgi:hypothetical protein